MVIRKKNIGLFIREVEEDRFVGGFAGPVYTERREYRPWVRIVFWSAFIYIVSQAMWIVMFAPK